MKKHHQVIISINC